MTYKQYLNQLNLTQRQFKKSLQNGFIVNEKLNYKVQKDGKFKHFDGNTIVMGIPNNMYDILSNYQNVLYKYCSNVLAERIPKETFHMTVHDLNNLYNDAYKNCKNKQGLFNNNYQSYIKILKDIDIEQTIDFKIFDIFSLNNKSIVVRMVPNSEKDFNVWINLYKKFDNILNKKEPMKMMHITLAYFKPNQNLNYQYLSIINEIQIPDTIFKFKFKDLKYSEFEDMANYIKRN